MTTPAVVYRHRATRSLRAKATMIVLRIRPPRRSTRLWNHRLSAEVGWFCSHSQASSTIVVRSRGLPRFGHTLLVIDRAALPWSWRQTGVGGHLPAVVEPAEQALRPQDGGDFGADTLQLHQHGRWRGHLLAGRLEQGVAFRRNALQLRQYDLEPIQLADDLRLQVHRQGPTVTGPQVLQSLTPTLAQRLVAEDPLGEEQPFDPVDVSHPLAHQRPALAANAPAVLLLRRRRPGHRTHPRLAALEGHQGAYQGLAIDPVGLRPPPPARGQDRGGIDHVALDPFGLQHPVDPEAVQAGLLDNNDRKVPAGPRCSFAPEFRKPMQQPRHIACRNRVFGHLLPSPRR